jgi:HlyD family secretion protein
MSARIDIGKVKLGDKASFTVDAFPNRLFAGEVIKIGRSPPTIQSDTISDAIISAVNPDLLLEPGMAVVIRIVVERRDEALRAPNQALRIRPTALRPVREPHWRMAHRSLVLRDGKLTAIMVQLGLDDGNDTEIVSSATS